MSLDWFFEKFELIADLPNAVAKMRELVLELSATGRLIPDALERTVKEDTKAMGTMVELVMGQAPAGDEYNTEGRGTVFVKVGEFGPLYPREEVWTTKPLKFAKKGDVLVCVVGATVGKLNIAIDCAIGRSVAAIRPTTVIDTKFLYYSLIPYTLRLRGNSRGSAQGVIGKAELNAVLLWVPSHDVQKRIVAKVDELMALCDQLEAQQQEREARKSVLARAALSRFAAAPTPANLNLLFHPSYTISPSELRKTILTLAVRGKLVPQDRNDEMVPSLPLPGSLELDLHKLPLTWAWTTWEGVLAEGKSAFKRGPFGSSLRKSDFVQTGYKVYEQYCPINDDCSFSRYYITPEKFETMKSFAVQAGDFLISCSGVTLGRITQVPTVFEPGVINQAILRVRINSEILDASYFKMLFRSPFFQERIFANSTGSAIPNVKGVKDLKAMPIPLPPLNEQRRIVAKVEQLMALVDALEKQLTTSREASEILLTTIINNLTTSR